MSATYFLPFLNEVIDFKRLDNLQNSYIHNNEEEKVFCVLYKFSGEKDFVEFEEKILNHELCLGHEDYEEYVLYKFKIPDDVCKKLDILMNNNTSKGLIAMSEDDKRIIVRFARRRLLPNVELIRQRLDGVFSIGDLDMFNETFSNKVKKLEFENANDLYLRDRKMMKVKEEVSNG
jgi:hypothetical protein